MATPASAICSGALRRIGVCRKCWSMAAAPASSSSSASQPSASATGNPMADHSE
ncbi:Uncharacterised protein [Bordetella pertussis]|nr:Uncharacterised protein [Bordetella pertussis]